MSSSSVNKNRAGPDLAKRLVEVWRVTQDTNNKDNEASQEQDSQIEDSQAANSARWEEVSIWALCEARWCAAEWAA